MPKLSVGEKFISVTLSAEMDRRLREIAKSETVPITSIMRQALGLWLAQYDREQERRRQVEEFGRSIG